LTTAFQHSRIYHGTAARLERCKIERYMQNHVIDEAFGLLSDASHKNRTSDREAVVELHFDCFRDLLDTLDLQGAVKVLHCIMRKPEVFPNDYYRLWRRAHDEALTKPPYAEDIFRRILQSKLLRCPRGPAAPYPLLDGLSLHRGRQAGDMPPPESVGARGVRSRPCSPQRQRIHALP
jgi:hypothetical protein